MTRDIESTIGGGPPSTELAEIAPSERIERGAVEAVGDFFAKVSLKTQAATLERRTENEVRDVVQGEMLSGFIAAAREAYQTEGRYLHTEPLRATVLTDLYEEVGGGRLDEPPETVTPIFPDDRDDDDFAKGDKVIFFEWDGGQVITPHICAVRRTFAAAVPTGGSQGHLPMLEFMVGDRREDRATTDFKVVQVAAWKAMVADPAIIPAWVRSGLIGDGQPLTEVRELLEQDLTQRAKAAAA